MGGAEQGLVRTWDSLALGEEFDLFGEISAQS